MTDHALIFDCDFLTAPGSPSRFWCGPRDPDPVIAQIGAVKLDLGGDFAILDTLRLYVRPYDRFGRRLPLDPFFSKLTGVTEADLEAHGLRLKDALSQLKAFASDAQLWSWGKDEFNMIAISCYLEGIAPPIPATQFGNACDLMLKAGMPYEDLIKTRSNTLASYFKIDHPPLKGHDALDDARSVAYVVQKMLKDGKLLPNDMS